MPLNRCLFSPRKSSKTGSTFTTSHGALWSPDRKTHLLIVPQIRWPYRRQVAQELLAPPEFDPAKTELETFVQLFTGHEGPHLRYTRMYQCKEVSTTHVELISPPSSLTPLHRKFYLEDFHGMRFLKRFVCPDTHPHEQSEFFWASPHYLFDIVYDRKVRPRLMTLNKELIRRTAEPEKRSILRSMLAAGYTRVFRKRLDSGHYHLPAEPGDQIILVPKLSLGSTGMCPHWNDQTNRQPAQAEEHKLRRRSSYTRVERRLSHHPL